MRQEFSFLDKYNNLSVLTKTQQRLSTLEYYRGESLTVARLQELKGNSNKAFYIRAMQKYTDLNIEQVNLFIQANKMTTKYMIALELQSNPFRPHLQLTNKVSTKYMIALELQSNPFRPHLQLTNKVSTLELQSNPHLQLTNKLTTKYMIALKLQSNPFRPHLQAQALVHQHKFSIGESDVESEIFRILMMKLKLLLLMVPNLNG